MSFTITRSSIFLIHLPHDRLRAIQLSKKRGGKEASKLAAEPMEDGSFQGLSRGSGLESAGALASTLPLQDECEGSHALC